MGEQVTFAAEGGRLLKLFFLVPKMVASPSAPIINQEHLFATVGGLVWPVHRDAVYLGFEAARVHRIPPRVS